MATIAKISFLDNEAQESKSPTEYAEVLRYSFTGHEPLDIDLGAFPDDVMRIAAFHGIKQKISDSYAEAKGDIDFARASVQDMVKRLQGGEWNVGGTGVAKESLLAKALAELTGQDLSDCIAKLATKTKEEKAEMRKHPQLKPILLRMEAERAQERASAAQAAAQDAPALDF
jgi:hypothetical protein